MNKSLYQADKVKSKKIYFAEFQKEFKNVEGPGPGKYTYEQFDTSFSPSR